MELPRKRRIRAVIYCRISLATHGDRVKVKRQEKLCREVAKRLGWDVVHVYCDNNLSAWQRNRKRPDWDAMLAAVERGEVDAIVVYHGDRLIRQPWDLEILLSLSDGRGIRLASPVGTRDLSDPEDRYRLRQDVAAACRESDRISQRTRDAHADRAAKGIVKAGGYRPFGYKRSGKIKESEGAEYRDAVARILAGESKTSIVADWNKRGVLTTVGNAWQFTAFSKMMTRPRYGGLSMYKGEIVGKGKWKGLIDRETWESLQAALGARAERFGPAEPVTTAKYLLTGIATHPACGSTVKIYHGMNPDMLSYLCSDRSCPAKTRRNVRNTDEFVIGAVLARLADPRLWMQMEHADDMGAGVELAQLERRKQSAMAKFVDSDTMTEAELETLLRGLNERIEAAQLRIEQRRRVHVLDGCRKMTREAWNELPIDRRRAIVRATVTVELLPSRRGRGFDPESVRVLPVVPPAAEGESGSVSVLPSAAD